MSTQEAFPLIRIAFLFRGAQARCGVFDLSLVDAWLPRLGAPGRRFTLSCRVAVPRRRPMPRPPSLPPRLVPGSSEAGRRRLSCGSRSRRGVCVPSKLCQWHQQPPAAPLEGARGDRPGTLAASRPSPLR